MSPRAVETKGGLIFTKAFRFLWEFPLQWDTRTRSILYPTKTMHHYKVYFGVVIFSQLLLALGGINAVLYETFLPMYPLRRVSRLLQILTCGGFALIQFTLLVLLKDRKSFVKSFNALSQFERTITKGTRRGQSGNGVGWMLVILLRLFASGIVLAPAAFVSSDMDPLRFMLDHFLPHPYFRSSKLIVICFIIRLVVFGIVCAEICRSLAFFTLILVLVFEKLKSILMLFKYYCQNSTKAFKIYQFTVISSKTIVSLFEEVVHILITLYFVVVVSLTWICVKGSVDSVGWMMYCWCVVLEIAVVTFGTSILHFACECFEKLDKLLKCGCLISRLNYRKQPTKAKHLVMLQFQGQMPIRLEYVVIGYLGKIFVVAFSYELVIRCIDAILLFDFDPS